MADEIKLEVDLEPDKASAKSAAEVAADAFEDAMLRAVKTFVAELRKGVSAVGKAFANDPGMRRFQVGLNGIVEELKDAANAGSRFTQTFEADLQSLAARARAVQKALADTGRDPGLGAAIEVQLRKTLELQKDAEANAADLARNPELVRAYEHRADTIRSALAQDVRFANKLIEQQTQKEISELSQRTAAAAAASRERIAAVNAERSRNVVAQQRAGAIELEESRRISRLKLQDERASARQRLAILNAVSQQIRALERGISATFRGAGSILGGIAGGVSSATNRITGIFRRADSQINDGLAPALNRRTSIFRRELNQTESVIRSSTIRQSVLLQRAEAQASTGIAGIASGRSQLGSLLGGGLAIGGGFALITKLREGFAESVNLNESLNKTRQVFGSAAEEIEAFADTSVEALFVTGSAALEAAANFGIFGKSAGLAGPELASFSKTLTVLATDLASFNNTSIADATTAIAAALRGESEPIRKYGVLLNEAVLQQRAFDEKITDTIRKLTPQERVLAANAEILAQTAIQQGDAARTADDFANSSRRAAAASVEFFASIAKFAIPLATLLTNGILPALKNLTDLVNNEVGPGLRILRDGLIGAGAALGGLFAAKGAFEALKFLAIGVQALLTPMGLLVTAVGLVGAAVKILAERSPTLRAALDSLRDTVGDLVSGGLRLAGELFETLSNIVTERLLPAVERLASFVAANLQAAFRAAVGFVESRVIPVFLRLVGFVRDELLPPFLAFVDVVRDQVGRGLNAARDAAVSFFEAVQPFIDPMIAGFQQIDDAIQDVFRGNFDGALTRLQAFGRESVIVAGVIGTGIALAFVNPLLGIGVTIAGLLGVAFGPRLLDSLRPQVERLRGFLSDLFDDIDFEDVGLKVLGVVRRIGELLGTVLTDRIVVLVAAAAVTVAGAFLLGFAEGVRNNIPELINLLGDALSIAFREAFKFALSNPEILVAALAGAAVLSAFRRAFAAAGAVSAGSFTKSFAAGTRSFFGSTAFNQGFFGGIGGLEAAATRQAQRESAALSRARERANRDLALLNQPLEPLRNIQGQVLEGPGDSIAQLERLKAKLGDVQVAGALMRENVNRSFGSIGVAAAGAGQVISGNFSGGFRQITAGAAGLASNVKQIFVRLGSDLKNAAGGLGVALGSAIAAGIGAALSGQAAGSADSGLGVGIGIAGILSSALFATAATGGNVGVGVAVAAIGGVAAALSANEKATKKAKDEMNEYAQALRGAKTASDAFAGITNVIEQNLADESDEVVGILSRTGFTFATFTRQVQNDSVNARQIVTQFFNSVGPDGAEAIKFLQDNIDIDTFGELAEVIEQGGAGSAAFRDAIHSAGFELGDFLDTMGFLGDEAGELGGSLSRVDLEEAFKTEAADRGLQGVTSRVDGLRAAVTNFPVGGGLAQFTASAFTDEKLRRIEDTATAIDDVGSAIDDLNQKRTDQINAQLSTISDTLAGVRESAELATDAITSPFDRGTGSANALRDQLLGQITGVGQEVGEALALDVFSALGSAQFGQATRGFTEAIQDLISQAVTDNPDITNAELADLLSPVLSGISQAVALDPEDMFDEAAGQQLSDIVNGILADQDFEARVDFAQGLQDQATALQDQWNALNVQLEADVTFSKEQIRRALTAAGLTPDEAARALGLVGGSGLGPGFTIGQAFAGDLPAGVVAALDAGVPEVEAAARRLATAAELALADQLEIHSPSRVFFGLGIEIPAGLAEGILAGRQDAAVALRVLSADVFRRVQSLPGTLAENFATLFEAVPNNIQTISESIGGFVSEVFTAISAMEDLAGVDLSQLAVGLADVENPLSNAGLTANQFANDLRFQLQGSQQHPAGWVQTEDGTWVPPSFFAPPPMLGQPTPSLDRAEGAVTAASLAPAVRIDTVNITEATNARATARETIMSLKSAAFVAQPLPTANRVPVDVGSG